MIGEVLFALLAVLELANPVFGAVNIALVGVAKQSSLYENGFPDRAIDGNRESDWGQESCSHTLNDLGAWWRVDLLESYKITKIIITNRGDAVPQRINGAEIRIGDSLDANGNANPRCAVISTIPAGGAKPFLCNGMEGRYVNIVIPERQEYLTLCEVEVYGEPSNITIPVANVARSGTVQQSSVFEVGYPEKAVDGNRDSTWSHLSCSHTVNDISPWWRVDLIMSYRIHKVVITNRGDCCPERINGAEIRIGNSLEDNGNSNPRCTVITTIPSGVSDSFFCNGMEGRYVNIVIPGRQEYLTLCEVEVYGVPLDGTFPADTNIARGGTVAQSTVFEGAVPERAIDGNRDSAWSHGSCSHTVNDINPWWRLDLLKTSTINKVIITNRGDAVPERINGAEIRIGDSPEDNGNSNPVCTVISSIRAGASQTFLCSGMEGRYINIMIPGRQEYLTLCEVEVYGAPSDGTSPIANVARAGTAAQSSVFEYGLPGNAIDGNLNSVWAKRSCSHTRDDTKPWWRVDLLSSKRINKVVITNRKDCCSQRINGAEIRIGDSLGDNGNDNPRCTVITGIPAGVSQTFYCNGMEGRYVNIVIPNRQEYLTLCEVEVYGEEIPEV